MHGITWQTWGRGRVAGPRGPRSAASAAPTASRTWGDGGAHGRPRPAERTRRSPLVTTEQLRDQLGIEMGGHNGVVVAAVLEGTDQIRAEIHGEGSA